MTNDRCIQLLATCDGLFFPIRQGDDHRARATINQRRRAYLSRGLPYAAVKGDAECRKARERSLAEDVQAGAVVVYKPRGRTLGIRLSQDVDAHFREKLGLPGWDNSLVVLHEMFRQVSRGHAKKYIGWQWLSEAALTGIEWGDNDNRGVYVALTADLLPALWRGFALSNSDRDGRAWYALSAAGMELVKGRQKDGRGLPPSTFPPADPPPGDEALYTQYKALRRAEIIELLSAELGDPSELGAIPLPVSWPGG